MYSYPPSIEVRNVLLAARGIRDPGFLVDGVWIQGIGFKFREDWILQGLVLSPPRSGVERPCKEVPNRQRSAAIDVQLNIQDHLQDDGRYW